MSKTRSVWYRLGNVREERLSFHLARFLLFHPKAVIKEVLVLHLGTKGTSKLLTSSLVCAAATDVPWHDGHRDVDRMISLLCSPPAQARVKAQGRTG